MGGESCVGEDVDPLGAHALHLTGEHDHVAWPEREPFEGALDVDRRTGGGREQCGVDERGWEPKGVTDGDELVAFFLRDDAVFPCRGCQGGEVQLVEFRHGGAIEAQFVGDGGQLAAFAHGDQAVEKAAVEEREVLGARARGCLALDLLCDAFEEAHVELLGGATTLPADTVGGDGWERVGGCLVGVRCPELLPTTVVHGRVTVGGEQLRRRVRVAASAVGARVPDAE